MGASGMAVNARPVVGGTDGDRGGVEAHASRGLAVLDVVAAPMHAVRVRTLGGFGIVRDGRLVRAAEWNSKKARDLLKLLICKRGRSVPREVLIGTLWPEEEPARCSNRLSVALSTVRSMLDPEHRHEPDHFVRSDKHLVALTNLPIDVEEFLATAVRVTGRPHDIDQMCAAEALYTGDFLEEDAYEDWAVSLREQARAAYFAIARNLVHAAAAAGAYDLAVRMCLRVLDRDPYDEEVHLSLISVLSAAGHHGQARVAYSGYLRRMAELEIEPAPFPELRRRVPPRPTVRVRLSAAASARLSAGELELPGEHLVVDQPAEQEVAGRRLVGEFSVGMLGGLTAPVDLPVATGGNHAPGRVDVVAE